MKTSTTKMKEGLLLTLALFASSLISCEKKDPVTMVSQETLLTDNVSKSWRITMSTRDTIKTLNATCKTTSVQNLDNKLVFTKGGAFRYDNGTITEDVSCQVNGCCSDLANLICLGFLIWLSTFEAPSIFLTAIIDPHHCYTFFFHLSIGYHHESYDYRLFLLS